MQPAPAGCFFVESQYQVAVRLARRPKGAEGGASVRICHIATVEEFAFVFAFVDKVILRQALRLRLHLLAAKGARKLSAERNSRERPLAERLMTLRAFESHQTVSFASRSASQAFSFLEFLTAEPLNA